MTDNNITYEETVAEFKTGKTLKYRIVEVTRHLRVIDNEAIVNAYKWIDKVQYIGQRLVHKGLFSRKWETIEFKDGYGSIVYFDHWEDIIDWFKYLDGEKHNPIKYYSSKVQ